MSGTTIIMSESIRNQSLCIGAIDEVSTELFAENKGLVNFGGLYLLTSTMLEHYVGDAPCTLKVCIVLTNYLKVPHSKDRCDAQRYSAYLKFFSA
jgi:hypothetical protein